MLDVKPLLLIDVDGVLNAFGTLWSEEYEAQHFEPLMVHAGLYTIRIPKGMRERIARLTEVFEPMWCTYWEAEAHPFWAEPLALAEAWPHMEWTRKVYNPQGSWKTDDVERWLDSHEPQRSVAWLDDEFGPRDHRWAHRRELSGAKTLLQHTKPQLGLTDANVDYLVNWAQRVG